MYIHYSKAFKSYFEECVDHEITRTVLPRILPHGAVSGVGQYAGWGSTPKKTFQTRENLQPHGAVQ